MKAFGRGAGVGEKDAGVTRGSRRRSATVLGLVALGWLACSPDQGPTGRAEQDFQTNVGLFLLMDSGNCLHSRKQTTNLGVLRCVPAPRSVCRNDGLQDAGGNLIVTRPTADRVRLELAEISADAPACADEVAFVLLQPAFRATSTSAYESIRANNVLETTGACSTLSTAQSAKLASGPMYRFLSSPRGTVARRARTNGDQTCLEQLLLDQAQRSELDAVHSGSTLLETSCFYGSGSLVLPFSTTRCAQTELDAAFIFDFSSK